MIFWLFDSKILIDELFENKNSTAKNYMVCERAVR